MVINFACETRKISLILYAWTMTSWIISLSVANPVLMSNSHPPQSRPLADYGSSPNGDDNGDVLVPLDGTTLKSILLYNRLNQLVQNEPEMLDLFDMDRGHLARIIDELLSQSNQIRSRKFLNVKSSKRAAAMGVDLPDYILHINKGRNFDFSSFREKMQKSG